jgi:hypothetical protein
MPRGGGSRAKQGLREEGIDQARSRDQFAAVAKPDHPVSLGSGQRNASRITTPRMAPTPHWCPPVLTPSQRRKIQQMRAQKLMEEVVEKERDEHFNTIWPVIPMK